MHDLRKGSPARSVTDWLERSVTAWEASKATNTDADVLSKLDCCIALADKLKYEFRYDGQRVSEGFASRLTADIEFAARTLAGEDLSSSLLAHMFVRQLVLLIKLEQQKRGTF